MNKDKLIKHIRYLIAHIEGCSVSNCLVCQRHKENIAYRKVETDELVYYLDKEDMTMIVLEDYRGGAHKKVIEKRGR